ncbi:hypothetical protein Ccrd_004319 [Cynara cardunculus var. scolymus]|uniref:peroxidase n=1 Tax=Cynara cardunculus var. scolymus TaxID=59895 RepID=A0A103XMY5_CYNCS|nr:hypothetical protein Ccrd_004319 [Cynara cardunculus var. scolymus]
MTKKQILCLLVLSFFVVSSYAQLRQNFYQTTCPNVESIVRSAVNKKFQQTFVTIPATLRLFFHDCFVRAGGPSYKVELGRRDGRISTISSVQHRLPHPDLKLDQLNTMFAAHGLSQTDMIALSGAHTLGFSHCGKFSGRIYSKKGIDPTLNRQYALQLRQMCPLKVDPRIAINMDPTTPRTFDNAYFQNLQQGKGLFASDQILFTDSRSKSTVNQFASSNNAFNQAFVNAITKLGRVGVLTGNNGEIRRDCTRIN